MAAVVAMATAKVVVATAMAAVAAVVTAIAEVFYTTSVSLCVLRLVV